MNAFVAIESLPPLMSFDGVMEDLMALPETDSVDVVKAQILDRFIAVTDRIVGGMSKTREAIDINVNDIATKLDQLAPVDVMPLVAELRIRGHLENCSITPNINHFQKHIDIIIRLEKQAQQKQRRAKAAELANGRYHVERLLNAAIEYLTSLHTAQWRLLELKAEAEGGDIELTDPKDFTAYLAWKLENISADLKASTAEAKDARKRIDANIGSIVKHQKRTDRMLAQVR